MIFDLIRDFAHALDAMPPEHPRHRLLKLLDEAIRRDIHFIARHRTDYPQALFQCLWNTCWWYDANETSEHYADVGEPRRPGDRPMHAILEDWRAAKRNSGRETPWFRSLRPPILPLGTAQRVVFCGHQGQVSCLAFSPDGRAIVSGSNSMIDENNALLLWEPETGRPQIKIPQQRGITSLAFRPDGRSVLCSYDFRTRMRLWDVTNGRELSVLEHKGGIESISFSADGRRLLIASTDRTARVWDWPSGNEVFVLSGHCNIVETAVFSPDGSYILTGSMDNVRLWDATTGRQTTVFEHKGGINSVAFSPDQALVVSGSHDRTARLWERSTGKELFVWRHESGVQCVAFSPDGCRAATASGDGVRLWDVRSGGELAGFRGYDAPAMCVAFSKDGRYVLSDSGYQMILWDPSRIQDVPALRGHDDTIFCTAVSADDRFAITGSQDMTVRLWDSDNGAELGVYRGHVQPVVSVAISPDNEQIAAGTWAAGDGGRGSGKVRIWQRRTGREIAASKGHGTGVKELTYSPDGSRLVGGMEDGSVRIYDAATGRERGLLLGHGRQINCISFSPTSRVFVTGSDDRSLRLWNADSGEPVGVCNEHRWAVQDVWFTSDGGRICSSDGADVRVWDVATCERIEVHPETNSPVSIAATPIPLTLVSDPLQTICRNGRNGLEIGRLATSMEACSRNRSGTVWIGAAGKYLGMFRLEGVDDVLRPADLKPTPACDAWRKAAESQSLQKQGDAEADGLVRQGAKLFRARQWLRAAAVFRSLLARGGPLAECGPKLAICLLNIDRPLTSDDARHVYIIIRLLRIDEHFDIARDLDEQLRRKLSADESAEIHRTEGPPRRTRRWWQFWKPTLL